MIPYEDYPIWAGVEMMVMGIEGHVAAMGDGGCCGVWRSPAQKFWKNVRTKRTKRTKSVGGVRWRESVVRWCGLRVVSVEAWGFRPLRITGQWLLAAAVEWAG